MKIGLLSDNHGYWGNDISTILANVDEIWHAGDFGSEEILEHCRKMKPTRAVWRNIDSRNLRLEIPENQIFEAGTLKVLMSHILGYPGKYTTRAKELITTHQPDIVICGHSHILKVLPDKRFHHVHINPGACGYQGWHIVRTLIIFDILESKISNLKVIELGPKSRLVK